MKFLFNKLTSIAGKKLNIVFLSDVKILPSFLKLNIKAVTETLEMFENFNCKFGEMLIATIETEGEIKRFLFCGTGSVDKLNRVKVQKLGGNIADKLNSLKVSEAGIFIDNDELKDKEDFFVENICEGIKLKNYVFDKYYIAKKDKHRIYLEKINIYANNSSVEKLFSEREKIINATHFARDLVSEPGNTLNPDSFVSVCKELEELGVKVKVLDKKSLKVLGMNAILAVGQGSDFGTYAISMEWNGDKSSNKDDRPIAFIGKGVTFDTGGINLKPSGPSITMMKYDMGGAAVVTALIKSLAQRKAKINVVGMIGLAENMPSSSAQRPGDVITSMSGQTIEVDNTDAEGRLLLADVMWYAQENFKPKIMIDLATLTGAIIMALGHHNAGIFSNDDELAKQLHKAGEEVGERVWRLPLDEFYDDLINSKIADIRNVGKGGAGSITAAQFLKRFVQKDCAWVHIDIAGVNWLDEGGDFSPKGATGYGVRLLNEFLIRNYEK
jgi:leucyl aminopeptidase